MANTGWFAFTEPEKKEKPKIVLPKAIVLQDYGPYDIIALLPLRELGDGAYVVFAKEHDGERAPRWRWRSRPFVVVSGDRQSFTRKTAGMVMTTLALPPDMESIPVFESFRSDERFMEARDNHIRGWLRMLSLIEKKAEEGDYANNPMQVFKNGVALDPKPLDKKLVFSALGLPSFVSVGNGVQSADERSLFAERVGAMHVTAAVLQMLDITIAIDTNAWLQMELGPTTGPLWRVADNRPTTPEAKKLLLNGWVGHGLWRHMEQMRQGIVPVTNDMRHSPLASLADTDFDPHTHERDDYGDDEDDNDNGRKRRKKGKN